MPSQNKADTHTKICPQCGSTRIRVARRSRSKYYPSEYECTGCRYNSHIFPEVEKDKVDFFREHISNRHRTPPHLLLDYGPFRPGFVAKLTGPVFFLTGMLLLLMLMHHSFSVAYPGFFLVVGAALLYISYGAAPSHS